MDWLILDYTVRLLRYTIYTNHLGGNIVQKNKYIKFEVVAGDTTHYKLSKSKSAEQTEKGRKIDLLHHLKSQPIFSEAS